MDANKLTLAEMAVEVLTTADGKAKTDLSLRHAEHGSRLETAKIRLPSELQPRRCTRQGQSTPSCCLQGMYQNANLDLLRGA